MKDVEAVPAKSGMSLVFNMAPGYRNLYRWYLLLQHGLSVTGSVFNVSVKDLAVLYEYWCFIKLNSLMKQHYELNSQDIIKVVGNGLFVSLIKGQRSRVRYRNPENGEEITLSYNPREISGATVPQKPDNVLSLKKNDAKVKYEYISCYLSQKKSIAFIQSLNVEPVMHWKTMRPQTVLNLGI